MWYALYVTITIIVYNCIYIAGIYGVPVFDRIHHSRDQRGVYCHLLLALAPGRYQQCAGLGLLGVLAHHLRSDHHRVHAGKQLQLHNPTHNTIPCMLSLTVTLT